jgi:hypothetical protein
MASLPPGGKPTDRLIPTPKVPRKISDNKKKSLGGGKPPASAKRDMFTNKMKGKGQPMAGKRKGGPRDSMPVPMKKTTSVRKTRTRRMIP